MVIRFIKFGAVGATGFLVDITIYTLLFNGLGVPALWSRGNAYWVSASWNWMLNRNFTFGDASRTRRRSQWLKYLGMCAVSFVPSQGTFYLLTSQYPFFAEYSQLALVAGVIAGMLFNFTGAHLLIFKPGDKPGAEPT